MSNEKLGHKSKSIKDLIIKEAKKVQTDNNTVVLMICLLVSTLFWFLKALNDDYRTEVEFPIEFTNIPRNYEFYGEIPEKLSVTIEDDGFTIMRYKFSYVFTSLKFDVSKHFKKNKGTQLVDGELLISQAALRNGIEQELIANSNLIAIHPEKIGITYSKLQERQIPIQVVAEITTEQQYIINGKIRTTPDSVSVIGASKALDEIDFVYTQPIRAQNLNDSLLRSVGLQAIEGVDFAQKKVRLCIPVESFTEKIIASPVVGIGFPDSLQIRTFPGIANISCICGLSVYKNVHPSDFTTYVRYEDVQGRNNGHVTLEIESRNEYAKRVLLRTKSVDYLIEKR